MKKFILVVVCLSALPVFALNKTEAEAIVAEANKLYEAQKFQEAYEKYKQAEENYTSFGLQYNFGNACYKLGKIPEAILHYERAKKINPYDEDLYNNIAVANLKVTDKIEALPSLGVTDFWNNITSEGSLSKWTSLTIAFIIAGFALMSLYIWKKRKNFNRGVFGIGGLMLLCGLITFSFAQTAYNRIQSNTEAIIFTSKVDVRTSPDEQAGTAFVIHAGTKISIRTENAEWIEVRIASGNVGWIKKGDSIVI
ncbi:MAG: tetratricopeptide repeat protein [Flavobacteriales bacterium]|nr:tetratricopeptide repeat protein [Flavobacteriales bacterium]